MGGACTAYGNYSYPSPSGKIALRLRVNYCERSGRFDFEFLMQRGRILEILYDYDASGMNSTEADGLIAKISVAWINEEELSIHIPPILSSESSVREFGGVRVVVDPN
jgi:hypothetical protein